LTSWPSAESAAVDSGVIVRRGNRRGSWGKAHGRERDLDCLWNAHDPNEAYAVFTAAALKNVDAKCSLQKVRPKDSSRLLLSGDT
jgi:hypothetical protein